MFVIRLFYIGILKRMTMQFTSTYGEHAHESVLCSYRAFKSKAYQNRLPLIVTECQLVKFTTYTECDNIQKIIRQDFTLEAILVLKFVAGHSAVTEGLIGSPLGAHPSFHDTALAWNWLKTYPWGTASTKQPKFVSYSWWQLLNAVVSYTRNIIRLNSLPSPSWIQQTGIISDNFILFHCIPGFTNVRPAMEICIYLKLSWERFGLAVFSKRMWCSGGHNWDSNSAFWLYSFNYTNILHAYLETYI